MAVPSAMPTGMGSSRQGILRLVQDDLGVGAGQVHLDAGHGHDPPLLGGQVEHLERRGRAGPAPVGSGAVAAACRRRRARRRRRRRSSLGAQLHRQGDADGARRRPRWPIPRRTGTGSGIPATGMIPMAIPAFSKTLKATRVKQPAARSRPKASRASWALRSSRHDRTPSRARTPAAPTKPSCSPTAEKMKSVCCSGT